MTRSLAAAFLFAGALAMSAQAQTVPGYAIPADATVLTVTAQGEASAVPDIASLSVGVLTEAPDGNTALRDNATRMNRVMTAIRGAGVAERDVKTSGVHLSPQYAYQPQQTPRITGYQASNTVTIKVREIAKLGGVLDALAGAGANQIHGPTFEIDQPEPLYQQARRSAVDQARARAATYAEALGLNVRRVVALNEGGGYRPQPMLAMARMAADTAEVTPVAPGENTVSVQIEVVFELGR
jgi:uncharacterized protein